MLEANAKAYQLLTGGGEMGALTRAFDWSSTPVGAMAQWPGSLRTMIDVILHSEVPMLVWWGEELTQFYNDAFRASFGHEGKHPAALGQSAEACWTETWPVVKPLIDRVREGGATWSEDQLIPIYRNGKSEDAYWTFGYSPIRNDIGQVEGVLVVCNETTKQVAALKNVAESEATLRSVILHAPVGICIMSGDPLTVDTANDIYLELVGKTRSAVEGRRFKDVLPGACDVCSDVLENVLVGGVPFERKEELVRINHNGREEIRYIDFVIEAVRDDARDSRRKVTILAIDVTDKVDARRKVEESEQKYKTLITESTVALAWYAGPELRIQYVNEIMTGYWGKDMSVVGKTLAEAVPELGGQSFLGKLAEVYRTGITYTGSEEEAWLSVDGKLQPFFFNFIYKALRDSNGAIYGIHHMAMDVTERVRARKKVEQSEANLRNIILKAPVAMCILRGREFVVDIANDRMFGLWGKERGQMINKPLFSGLPEVKNQGFEELLERVYATGETFTAFAVPTNLPRNEDIETLFVNFVYEPFRDPDGHVSGIIAVATDVTAQVKARQKVEELVAARTRELKDANRDLHRSNDELAQFAYVASHDLQEPARKISTFTGMLEENLQNIDPRSQSLLKKIDHASTRMLSLIRDILTYSQLAKENEQVGKVDLNEILDATRSDFELLIEEKSAIITGSDLPVVTGIRVQIAQLFANLVSNALKFAKRSRKTVISITSTSVSEELRKLKELKDGRNYHQISFSDNGIGFNQTHAHQIFDIFQRLHGKSEYEGTGIGLAMCKKIVQNHNGAIWAESVEGEGTTFHVLLPAEAVERPAPAQRLHRSLW